MPEMVTLGETSAVFAGSCSIKSVLPVLVPELSYADLEGVHDGAEAQAAWNNLISLEAGDEKARHSKALREYCALDTFAMVELYRHLIAM